MARHLYRGIVLAPAFGLSGVVGRAVRLAVLLAVAGAMPAAGAEKEGWRSLHRTTLSVAPLGKGGYVVSGGITNTGFVIGETGVVAIDAQMYPEDAGREQAEIAKLTSKPVKAIVLSHSDPDHVNGLPGWPAGIRVIAHENVNPEVEATIAGKNPYPRAQMPVPSGLANYLPTETVRRSRTMVIDGVKLILLHPAAAHTDSDLLIYLPKQKAVFCGDLLTMGDPNNPNGLYPVIHLEKHGSSLGWIRTMRIALGLDAKIYVAGHGPALISRQQLAASVEAAERRRNQVKALFDAGKTLKDIKAALNDPPPAGPLFMPTFVETTYDELLRE